MVVGWQSYSSYVFVLGVLREKCVSLIHSLDETLTTASYYEHDRSR